jgi:hypothetical protein
MDKMCDFLLVNLLKYTYRVDPKPHLSNLKLNCANPYISFKQPKVWVVCVCMLFLTIKIYHLLGGPQRTQKIDFNNNIL